MWSEVQAVAGLPAFEGLAESFAGPLLQDFKVTNPPCTKRRSSSSSSAQRVCRYELIFRGYMNDVVRDITFAWFRDSFAENNSAQIVSLHNSDEVTSSAMKGESPTPIRDVTRSNSQQLFRRHHEPYRRGRSNPHQRQLEQLAITYLPPPPYSTNDGGRTCTTTWSPRPCLCLESGRKSSILCRGCACCAASELTRCRTPS